jgi:two-component SAPR family response regulator
MNGIQLVKAVKKLRPDMKVVLTTAFDIDKKEWHHVMPSTEVDEFVTKPFRMLKLLEAIEKCAPTAHAESSRVDLHSLLDL